MKATTFIATAVLAASTVASTAAMAGSALTGNVGLMSEYYFRGVAQNESATASAGVDYDIGNGFAVGTWLADVGDGIEYDLYGSYSGEINDVSYSVGFTTYNYTGQFDQTYEAVNLGLAYGPISFEYNIGSYDGDFNSSLAGNQQDYTFAAITAEYKSLYAKYGAFGSDADGSYIEVGFNKEIGGFDTSVFLVSGDDQNTANNLTTETTTLIFTLGKSFDL